MPDPMSRAGTDHASDVSERPPPGVSCLPPIDRDEEIRTDERLAGSALCAPWWNRMNITTETLTVFLLLMPGFVSSAVLNAIVVRQAKDRVASIAEALVFSFVIYGFLAPFGRSPVDLEVTSSGIYPVPKAPTVTPELLPYAIVLAVGLALVLGFSITNDYHMQLLRKLGITASTARVNTWLDIFIDQRRRYVVVTFADGRRLFGWPEYYSNDTTEGLLYVSNAAWIGDDDEYTDLGVHGILLTNKNRQRIRSRETRPRARGG